MNQIQEHRTVSLADQVFDRLESEILSGTYAQGEILTELRLSDELGVSRTPIREALRRLEQEHIIEFTGKGILVLGITFDDLRDIYDIRSLVEPMAAAAAAKNSNPENITDLRDALDLQEYYVSRHNPEQIKYMDSKFHEQVYKLSGSRVLYDTLLPLHNKVQKYRRASVSSNSRAEQSLEEHRSIFKAVEANDAAAAAEAMKLHVGNAMRNILKED